MYFIVAGRLRNYDKWTITSHKMSTRAEAEKMAERWKLCSYHTRVMAMPSFPVGTMIKLPVEEHFSTRNKSWSEKRTYRGIVVATHWHKQLKCFSATICVQRDKKSKFEVRQALETSLRRRFR